MKNYRSVFSLLLLIAVSSCKHDEIKPQRRDIVDAVFGSGHLENSNQYTIMANATGFIDSSYVAEGDTVKDGQVLFRLANDVQRTQVSNAMTNLEFAQANAQQTSPQITQMELQIAQAQQKLQVDSTNYQRYARLVKTQAVAIADYDNIKLTYQASLANLNVLRKNLADLRHTLNLNVNNARAQYDIQKENNKYYFLYSKGPGVVMNVNKKTGDYVRLGDAIAMLGTGRIIIKLDIAENDIGRVQVGQQALISLNSEQDKTWQAVITKIYPSFNSTDQSFIAEATFKTQPDKVLNGTQLQANIILQEKKNVLVIPSYSLINDNYVMLAGSKEKKKVGIGIRMLEWTEIVAGLSENDILTLPKH